MTASVDLTQGSLTIGSHVVYGTLAEIFVVLGESTAFRDTLRRAGVTLEEVAAPLDTHFPAEDRIADADRIVRCLRAASEVGDWIPAYGRISEHEYDRQFYPAHRDHSIHVIGVYLLGWYLFETVGPLRNRVSARLAALAPSVRFSEAQRFRIWWTIASLYHDQGYPFEAERFISDEDFRRRTLDSIAKELNSEGVLKSFFRAGVPETASSSRELLRAGRFVAFEFQTVDEVLSDELVVVLDGMWSRLGISGHGGSVSRSIDRITTQAPRGRAPYHDHGLFGALMVLCVARESKRFLSEVVEASSSIPDGSRDIAYDAWVLLDEVDGLITGAAEAISYHNLSFDNLDKAEASSLLHGAARPAPSLAKEPLLFFLALCDTLQDWDRHHFVVNMDGRYRPAVPSRDILIQGAAQFVRVSKNDRAGGTASTVHRLLQGWLDEADVMDLIKDKAEYTRPDMIVASGAVTLADSAKSARERARLEQLVERTVSDAKGYLLQAQPDSLIMASSAVVGLRRQVRDSSADVLIPVDKEKVDKALVSSGLLSLEAQSAFLVRVGTKLSRGIVERRLGGGGFGTVYLVKTPDDHQLAFKMFHANDLEIEEKRRLFRRGFDAMQVLAGHPGIVRTHQFSELPVGFFMDYVPGTDLDDGLALFEEAQDRLEVGLSVSRTLAYAHANGVLHRDVKPGNVLLDSTRNNEPVLTDFDLAWIDGRTMNTAMGFATVYYGAPEQTDERLALFRSQPTVDIYSMGALMYYLLTRQSPPAHAQWREDYWSVLEKRLEGSLPATCVRLLYSLIRDCVQWNPKDRLQSMEELVSGLAKAHAIASSSGGVLAAGVFVDEAVYRASGESAGKRRFSSRAGGVSWSFDRIEASELDEDINVTVSFTLTSEPRFEGVNYEGFQKATKKNIDARLLMFEKEYGVPRPRRRGGSIVAGNRVELEILRLPRTIVGAAALAELMSSISRMIE